jgi:RNA polymerase sigma-70 factor (ECF subfamily)
VAHFIATFRNQVVICTPTPEQTDEDFVELLSQSRQFLLTVANGQLPAALRAKGGASDLVQETFATALRSRYQFHGATFEDLRAWLRAILLNKLTMFHRHYSDVAARDVTREVSAGDAENIPCASAPVVEGMIRDEANDSLTAAVTKLPDEMRSVVILRMEQGLAFGDIGERLGRSEEAARKLFTRAIDRLRATVPDIHA